jgi:hypothetical protein
MEIARQLSAKAVEVGSTLRSAAYTLGQMARQKLAPPSPKKSQTETRTADKHIDEQRRPAPTATAHNEDVRPPWMVTTSPAPPPPLAQASQPTREQRVNNSVEDTSTRRYPSAFGDSKVVPPSQVSLIQIGSRSNDVYPQSMQHSPAQPQFQIFRTSALQPQTSYQPSYSPMESYEAQSVEPQRTPVRTYAHTHMNETMQIAKLRIISQEVRDNSAIPVAPAPPPHQTPIAPPQFSPQR